MASKAAMLLNRRPHARHRYNELNGHEEKVAGYDKNKDTRRAKRRKLGAAWLGRERRWKLILIILLSLILLRWILRPLKIKYFGDHDMEGGEIGAKVDRRNRRFHRRGIEKRRRKRLKELGIVLPSLDEARNEKYLTITSDILARRAERNRKVQDVEQDVQTWRQQCESPSASIHDSNAIAIPRRILQPNYGSWYRPRTDGRMAVIQFEEHDMQSLIRDVFPSLLPLYDRSSIDGRTLLWSLCSLYRYGGYIFGKGVGQAEDLTAGLFDLRNTCQDVAVFKFIREYARHQLDFLLLAASPGHPLLLCALKRLENVENNVTGGEFILKSSYSPYIWNSSETRRVVEGGNGEVADSWEVIGTHCPAHKESSCCDSANLSASDNVNSRQSNYGKRESRIFVKVVVPKDSGGHQEAGEGRQRIAHHHTEVSVTERLNTPPPVKRHKISVRDVMKKTQCDAGWRCHRCLHDPLHGSYEACDTVCDVCFVNLICNERYYPPRSTVTFDVVVRQHINLLLPGEQQIPRVVHQTWFEDLNVDRYPQLTRVQSSWKNSGYQYRFYTDADARKYIATNFPSRFLDAYDSLIPGAFKVRVLFHIMPLFDPILCAVSH